MTIREALAQRVPRVRKPTWANPEAYLRLPLFADGFHGPWAELYDDRAQRDVLTIRPGSQKICVLLDSHCGTDSDWEPYGGPVSSHERDAENYARAYAER